MNDKDVQIELEKIFDDYHMLKSDKTHIQILLTELIANMKTTTIIRILEDSIRDMNNTMTDIRHDLIKDNEGEEDESDM